MLVGIAIKQRPACEYFEKKLLRHADFLILSEQLLVSRRRVYFRAGGRRSPQPRSAPCLMQIYCCLHMLKHLSSAKTSTILRPGRTTAMTRHINSTRVTYAFKMTRLVTADALVRGCIISARELQSRSATIPNWAIYLPDLVTGAYDRIILCTASTISPCTAAHERFVHDFELSRHGEGHARPSNKFHFQRRCFWWGGFG